MSATGDERRGENPSTMYPASADDVNTSASLRGRVCVVTGASRGIGQATSGALARCGATVVMVGRDRASLSHAVEQVEGDAVRAGGSVISLVADLASLTAIRALAREIDQRFGAVHALVNNAGVSVPRRRTSQDGIELTFAVNVLAPFVLTRELLPALRRGAPSRVVNVTSLFARLASIDFDDLEGARRYSGDRAYLQSKLALVLLTQRFAEQLRGTGVTALCVDPGLAVTDLLRERWWWRARWLRPLWNRLFLTPEEAASATVMAVASPALADAGGRWVDRRGRDVHLRRRWSDPAVAERLWRSCEHLTNADR